MNRHSDTRRRCTAGIKALTTLCALLLTQTVWSTPPFLPYEMSFVSNEAHGALISQGAYGLAAELLNDVAPDSVAARINLCVARVLAGQHRKARRDCNRAVNRAEAEALAATTEAERAALNHHWAATLTNRGVLRALRHQDGAERDFLQAMDLETDAGAAARNLVLLKDDDYSRYVAH